MERGGEMVISFVSRDDVLFYLMSTSPSSCMMKLPSSWCKLSKNL